MMRHLESGSLPDIAACDRRFHRLIWEMAGNRVCLRMFVPLHRIMTDSFAVSWSINDYSNAISAHTGIFEAIRARDPNAARRHMNEHLVRAEYKSASHAGEAA